MRLIKIVYIIIFVLGPSLLSVAQGKKSADKEEEVKKMDNRVGLRKDKSPYGVYYAYEYLKYVLPEAEIIVDN